MAGRNRAESRRCLLPPAPEAWRDAAERRRSGGHSLSAGETRGAAVRRSGRAALSLLLPSAALLQVQPPREKPVSFPWASVRCRRGRGSSPRHARNAGAAVRLLRRTKSCALCKPPPLLRSANPFAEMCKFAGYGSARPPGAS